MTYLDKYPNCIGCPVYQYCGTAVSSTKLCHSYKEEESKEEDDIEALAEYYIDLESNYL